MVQITESEKAILTQWVPGIDLSKIKIKTGRFVDFFCAALGATAVTSGTIIYAKKDSRIVCYPAGHPLRLASLVHELHHARQEKRFGLLSFCVLYASILFMILVPFAGYLVWKIIAGAAHWLVHQFSRFEHRLNPLERSAEKLEKKFLKQHWTEPRQ